VTGTLGDGTSRNYSTGITYSDWGSLSQEQFGTDTAVYNKLFYSSRGQLSEIRDSTTPNDTSWNRGAIINHYSDQCWGMCSGSSMTDNNGNLKNQDIYIPNNDQVSSYVTWRDHFDYDSLNRLQRVHEYADGTHDWQQEYTYDQWGNRRVHQTNTWGYNIPKPDFGLDPANNNRLSAPAGYTMSYDAAGNLTNDTYTGQGQRIYDAENRMTQAWANGQWQVYSYDGDGRRVKRRVSGQETWQVYGIGGELVAEYDANAAPSSAPLKEYGYRNGQLLVTAEPVNLALGKTATQSSTFSGMAASRAVDGNTDGAIWDGYASVTDYNTNGWWQVDLGSVESIGAVQVWGRTDCCPEMTSNFYVFVSDNPFTSTDLNTTLNQAGVSNYYVSGYSGTPGTINANRTGRYVRVQFSAAQYLVLGEVKVLRNTADVNWLVTDQLGSPRMIFDKTGSLANTKRHDYLPFGEELAANQGLRTSTSGYVTDSVRQKFSQKERDNETGLDYFGARYYGSMMGRFTAADSLLGSLTNPQTLNRYAYVGNDPLNFTDPIGHARFDVPGKDEQGGYLRENPYADAIAWQDVGMIVSAADAAAANASNGDNAVGGTAGKAGASDTEPQKKKETTADRIAGIAAVNVDSEAWRTSRARSAKRNPRIRYKAKEDKCNLFVYEVLLAAGVRPPTSGAKGKWPARAGEWGNPSVNNLTGWVIVTDGSVAPGDVISQQIPYSDASGHVAIIGPDGATYGTGTDDGVISRTDWGFRLGQGGPIERLQGLGPVVIRRYQGP
jgi:RHS repeat-associated protein